MMHLGVFLDTSLCQVCHLDISLTDLVIVLWAKNEPLIIVLSLVL